MNSSPGRADTLAAIDDRGEEGFAGKEENGEPKEYEWKPLPFEPVYYEYHPCAHRWFKNHPQQETPKYFRYNVVPMSSRADRLALPLCRDLERLLEEERMRREKLRRIAEAGEFDGVDHDGDAKKKVKGEKEVKEEDETTHGEKKGKKKGSKKEKKTGAKKGNKKQKNQGKTKGGKAKGKGKKQGKKTKGKKGGKKGGKGKKSGAGKKGHAHEDKGVAYGAFKGGKKGNLQQGWPHYLGMMAMQMLWTLTDSPPDEEYISRAPGYFDVQSRAILSAVCQTLGVPVPKSNTTSDFESKLVVASLNLATWIAKNVTGPANEIPNENVQKLLELHGEKLVEIEKKAKKGKKGKGKDKGGKKGKKGKGKAKKAEDVAIVVAEEPEPVSLRKWTQETFPVVVPAPQIVWFNELDENSDPERLEESEATKQERFLNTSKWYNPYVPEFMYDGPRNNPQGIEFVDLFGEMRWRLDIAPEVVPQQLCPHAVPPYFPILRPRQHRGEDDSCLRKTGPWFIMSQPEAYIEKEQAWIGTAAIEQFEMIANIIQTTMFMPEMSLKRFLELVAELNESLVLDCKEESLTDEERLIDDKRSIIFEKLYLDFFGSSFRDYDNETLGYMKNICRRCAILMRQLYHHTYWVLWNTQFDPRVVEEQPPSPEPESEDDPAEVAAWDDWIQFLQRTTAEAQDWQVWLQDAVNKGLEHRENLTEEGEEWLALGEERRQIAQEYAERAQFLQEVSHRKVKQTSVQGQQSEWEEIEMHEDDEGIWPNDE